jgi:methyl-accepting chemotaxis protein
MIDALFRRRDKLRGPHAALEGALAFGAAAEPAGGEAPAAHSLAVAEIGAGRERVAHRVEALKALTEHEILACGRVLSSIVDNVRGLIEETGRAVGASMARSDAATSGFIGAMQADVRAQEDAVSQVLALADGMQDAIEAINGLSHYSNILSINARIEAARIGERGAGFAVIADHTRELSKTIREAADRVSAAIGAVRAGLPPVSERAAAIQERTRAFIEVVGEEMKSASLLATTGSAGSRGLEDVMRLSNQALSHLQFQDPLAQQLSCIDQDIGIVEGRVRRVLDGELDLEPVAQEAPPAFDRPAPGKITLFQETP